MHKENYLNIQNQRNVLVSTEFLSKVLHFCPLMYVIVNQDRQILDASELMLKALDYKNIDEAIGKFPGDMLRCVHAIEGQYHCGLNNHCKVCGAVKCINKSIKTEMQVSMEASLEIKQNKELSWYDFKVTTHPFEWNGIVYYLVSFTDITDLKRRNQLEKVFLHDLMNKASSLFTVCNEMANWEYPEDLNEIMQLSQRNLNDLLEDITFQKKLLDAEHNILSPNYEQVDVNQIVSDISHDFNYTYRHLNKSINCNLLSDTISINIDKVLLRRVLINLTKNAIEAINPDNAIELNVSVEKNVIKFEVFNPGVIPENIQLQIFDRSFSTKGPGRGIGTYSVKLFTEKYLHGKAYFISNIESGTKFFIEIPT
jgi:hypothetical protein